MKIFVNARFLTQPVSGVQRYGIECSRQIKKLYPQAVFVAPPNILHKEIVQELGAEIVGSRTGHSWEQIDLPLYLRRMGSPPLFSPANTAPLLYRNNYFTLHDLAFHHHPEWNTRAFSNWYNVLVPRLARNAKHIFTVSQAIRSEIIKYYKVAPAQVSVTYNGLSEQMLAAGQRNNSPKEKIILSVGTFNKRKNHHCLVKAFLESSVKDDYQLVMVGDKNKVFAESGLDENLLRNANIKIYRQLSSEELINMYAKAEMLVSLSVYEGFGIPVLEGLYAGCKVICSDIDVYKELYDGYVSFCDPLDVPGISRLMDQVALAPGAVDPHRVDALLLKYNYSTSGRLIVEQMLSNK